MPAVRENRIHSSSEAAQRSTPPQCVPRRVSESPMRGRGSRRPVRSGHRHSASMRVPRHQPRVRIDQRPWHEEPPRYRRRSPRHRGGNAQSRSRRTRPEITILSVAPMSEHPAFADGNKGAYIPPEAPPSYEQAMRAPALSNRTAMGSSDSDPISEIRRVFPERHIVNCAAITIPSYTESIAQQSTTTVTTQSPTVSSPSSQEVRTPAVPVSATSGESSLVLSQRVPVTSTISSQSDRSSARTRNVNHSNNIVQRRDVRPTEIWEGPHPSTRVHPSVPQSSRTKPPKPALPPSRPALRPKPRTKPKPAERKNANSNNNSNKDDNPTCLTRSESPTFSIQSSNSDTVTSSTAANQSEAMTAANKDILSLFDAPASGPGPSSTLLAPMMPTSSTPGGGMQMNSPSQSTNYGNLDGLFAASQPHGGAINNVSSQPHMKTQNVGQSGNTGASVNYSNLDGLFSSGQPQGGSVLKPASSMNAPHGGNNANGNAGLSTPMLPKSNYPENGGLTAMPHPAPRSNMQPTPSAAVKSSNAMSAAPQWAQNSTLQPVGGVAPIQPTQANQNFQSVRPQTTSMGNNPPGSLLHPVGTPNAMPTMLQAPPKPQARSAGNNQPSNFGGLMPPMAPQNSPKTQTPHMGNAPSVNSGGHMAPTAHQNSVPARPQAPAAGNAMGMVSPFGAQNMGSTASVNSGGIMAPISPQKSMPSRPQVPVMANSMGVMTPMGGQNVGNTPVNSGGLMSPTTQISVPSRPQAPVMGNSMGVLTPTGGQNVPPTQAQAQNDFLFQHSQLNPNGSSAPGKAQMDRSKLPPFMSPNSPSEGGVAAVLQPTQLPSQTVGFQSVQLDPNMKKPPVPAGVVMPQRVAASNNPQCNIVRPDSLPSSTGDHPARKLPPPPRPLSAPRRPGVKPMTSPPPRPNAAPPSKPSPKQGAGGISLLDAPLTSPTKPTPAAKPANLMGPGIVHSGQPAPTAATQGVNLMGPSLLDDPFNLMGSNIMAPTKSQAAVNPTSSSENRTSPTKPIVPSKPPTLGMSPPKNIRAFSPAFPPQGSPTKGESPVKKEEEPEPVYAAVVKKDKPKNEVSTSPVKDVAKPAVPPNQTSSLLDMFGQSKSEVTEQKSEPPPPLPSTRPPLEDFEDLFSPAEMNAAMSDREKKSNAAADKSSSQDGGYEDIFGFGPLTSPQNDVENEDPYAIADVGLPHVKQSSAPPVLPAPRNRRKSKDLKSGPPPLPKSAPKMPEGGSVIYSKPESQEAGSPEATLVSHQKNEDGEKKFTKKLRRTSMKIKQSTMSFFKSTKPEENELKAPTTDAPTPAEKPKPTEKPAEKPKPSESSQAKPPQAAKSPPPRPTYLPKRAPTRPPTVPITPANNNNNPPVKSKPSKPPPPKITPMRAAPAHPPFKSNTNQNNRASPTPKPRASSGSKPNLAEPSSSTPVPQKRSVAPTRAAPPQPQVKPNRAPPAVPPGKKYMNLRPPPAPKPSTNKPAVAPRTTTTSKGPASQAAQQQGRSPQLPHGGAKEQVQNGAQKGSGIQPNSLAGSKVTAMAMFDFAGETAEDLNFKTGDTIYDVTEVDNDWFKGQSGGKYGIFPKGFVQIQQPADTGTSQSTPTAPTPVAEYPMSWDDVPDILPSLDEPETTPSDLGESPENEVKNTEEAFVDSKNAPNQDVTSSNQTPSTENGLGIVSEKEAKSEQSAPEGGKQETEDAADGTCVALYAFDAENDDELSFNVGDVIEIAGKVNEEWLKGKLNGKEGIFPVAYVDVHSDTETGHDQDVEVDANYGATNDPTPATSAPVGLSGFVEPMAKGIRNYSATSSEELSFEVDDVLYLLEKVDAEWLMVQHGVSGAVGNVPISHVNIVHPLP